MKQKVDYLYVVNRNAAFPYLTSRDTGQAIQDALRLPTPHQRRYRNPNACAA